MKNLTKRHGFTIIELITVTAIVSILTLVSTLNMVKSIPARKLKSETRTLINIMQSARMRAVSANTSCYIDFGITGKTNNNFYTVYLDLNNNGTFDPGEDIASKAPVCDQHYGLIGKKIALPVRFGACGPNKSPGNSKIPDDGISFRGNRVRFLPDGTASPSGTVYLTNGKKDNYAITVLHNTGRIKRWKWNGKKWEG